MSHTPYTHSGGIIRDKDNAPVADAGTLPSDIDRAAFIVRACNAWDDTKALSARIEELYLAQRAKERAAAKAAG